MWIFNFILKKYDMWKECMWSIDEFFNIIYVDIIFCIFNLILNKNFVICMFEVNEVNDMFNEV